MGDGEGQGLLPVACCFYVDPQGLTHSRVASVCPDQQAGRDLTPIGKRCESLGLAGHDPGDGDAGQEGDIGQVCQSGQKFPAQQPVRQIVAKGQIRDVGGVEIPDQARLARDPPGVGNPHDLQRRREGGKPRPEADTVEQAHRWLQKRGAAQIGTDGGGRGDRGSRIGADYIESRGAKPRRRRKPGNASAGNQNVCGDPCHLNPCVGAMNRVCAVNCPSNNMRRPLTPRKSGSAV